MSIVSMKQLLESGVHFGHQTKRWNPKMAPYIFTQRNGIYIIDLQKTVSYMNNAYKFIVNTVKEGGDILFVGTKKQASGAITEEAQRCGMHYVNARWLGGMLTNYKTIHSRLKRLEQLHTMEENGTFDLLTKKEAMKLTAEMDKLETNLGGIKNMEKLPAAIYIVDTNKENIAVAEARKLNIPIVAIVDTNCDPDLIDYVIPGNDDAIRAVKLISNIIANAVLEGKHGKDEIQGEPKETDSVGEDNKNPVEDAVDAPKESEDAKQEEGLNIEVEIEPSEGTTEGSDDEIKASVAESGEPAQEAESKTVKTAKAKEDATVKKAKTKTSSSAKTKAKTSSATKRKKINAEETDKKGTKTKPDKEKDTGKEVKKDKKTPLKRARSLAKTAKTKDKTGVKASLAAAKSSDNPEKKAKKSEEDKQTEKK